MLTLHFHIGNPTVDVYDSLIVCLEYILVALKILRNFITSSRGFILPLLGRDYKVKARLSMTVFRTCGQNPFLSRYGLIIFSTAIVIFVYYRQSAIISVIVSRSPTNERGLEEVGCDKKIITNPAQLPYGKISVIYGKTLEDVSNSHYGDNIFYSVKTTSQRQYYRNRILMLMLTWFQAVNKNKVCQLMCIFWSCCLSAINISVFGHGCSSHRFIKPR